MELRDVGSWRVLTEANLYLRYIIEPNNQIDNDSI